MIAVATRIAAAALGASDVALLGEQPAGARRRPRVVAFMQLAASLGPRNGHTGLGGNGLVGARLLTVGGFPVDQVLERIRPLVPHDNDATVHAFRFMQLMSAEVLAGLGIAPRFTFVLRNGRTAERTLAPVSAPAYSRGFGSFRMWPAGRAHARNRAAGTRLSLVAGGRVAYLAYNSALEDVGDDAARLLKLPARVRRVVVDVRNNPGGDNHTYPVLIDALRRLAARPKQLVVLAGRVTFLTPVDLPQTGLRVEIGTIWWVKSRRGAHDPRLTFHPDVVVPPTAAPWFAGRDPALAAALTAPFSKARAVH